VFYAGLRRKQVQFKNAFIAAAAYLLMFVAFCLLGALIMILGYKSRGVYILYSSDALTLGLLLIISGVSVFLLNRIVIRLGVHNSLLGFLLPWVFVTAISPFVMPGASYAFTWPLLLAAVPIGISLLRKDASIPSGLGSAAVLGVTAFPGILFTVGIMQGFYAALLFIFISLHIAVLMFAIVMLMPQLYVLTATIPKRTAAALIGLGTVFVLMGIFWQGFSPSQPKFNSITYGLNTDTGEAVYMSCDDAVDPWTEQFLGSNPQRLPITDFIPYAQADYLQAPAPALELAPPTLEVLEDSDSDGARTLHLRADTPRNAEVVEVYALTGTDVTAATVNGVPMTITDLPWRLSYSIYRGGGIDIVLQLADNSPAKFRVSDHKYYLENILDFEPRPTHYIPKPNTVDFNKEPLKSEESIVTATFEIPQETTQ
jgi:hypothetical protein